MDHVLRLVVLLFLVNEIAPYCLQLECFQRNPTTVKSPKKVITGINGPHNILITKRNEVYITGYFDRFLYRLDLAGNILEKFKLPTGSPCMLDMRGDTLYITNVANTVYSKQLFGHQPFRPFLTKLNQPVGFRISKDGSRIYVTEWQTGIVRIYDRKLKLIGTIRIPSPDRYPRKVLFDANGNVNIAAYSPRIYVYNDQNSLIRTVNHPGARNIDGFVNNCDGSRVLADRSGQVVFADEKGKTIKTIRGFGMRQPADVAIAPDSARTLWVADVIGHKVFLF